MIDYIDINGAHLDRLATDADFKTEALRLLPQAAKKQAEKLWQIMYRQLKLGSSQRNSFVREEMRPYRNPNSTESRAMLARIDAALRAKFGQSGK